MRYEQSWNGTTYVAIVTAFGRSRFRWRFETANGLKGDGVIASNRHVAIETARRAAETGINEAMDSSSNSSTSEIM